MLNGRKARKRKLLRQEARVSRGRPKKPPKAQVRRVLGRRVGDGQARRKAILVMDKLRAERGMLSRIARELGVKAQAVHQWDMVPLERVLDVERVTGIPREELRPDFHLTRAVNLSSLA